MRNSLTNQIRSATKLYQTTGFRISKYIFFSYIIFSLCTILSIFLSGFLLFFTSNWKCLVLSNIFYFCGYRLRFSSYVLFFCSLSPCWNQILHYVIKDFNYTSLSKPAFLSPPWWAALSLDINSVGFTPAFSARVLGMTSKDSANLSMAYCSRPAQVWRKTGKTVNGLLAIQVHAIKTLQSHHPNLSLRRGGARHLLVGL